MATTAPIETYIWGADGRLRLGALGVGELPEIPRRERPAWLETFIPKLGAQIVREAVAQRPVYLAPSAHIARGWVIRAEELLDMLRKSRGNLVLRPAAGLNYYVVDFAASRAVGAGISTL